MSARAGAAQELGSGSVLGRLIPLEGSPKVPGATGSASKGVSVGWGRSITVRPGLGGVLERCEDVVGAAGDLARGRQGGTLRTGTLLDLEIELAIGAY